MAYTDEQIKKRYGELKTKIGIVQNECEKEFDTLRENIRSKLDPKYIEELGIDVDTLTAKHWLPHLYIEPFDGEEYEKERQEAQKFLDRLYQFKEAKKAEAAKEMGLE